MVLQALTSMIDRRLDKQEAAMAEKPAQAREKSKAGEKQNISETAVVDGATCGNEGASEGTGQAVVEGRPSATGKASGGDSSITDRKQLRIDCRRPQEDVR